MSKRITLSKAELALLDIVLSAVLEDGGDYAKSGKIGKRAVRDLMKRLGLSAPNGGRQNG